MTGCVNMAEENVPISGKRQATKHQGRFGNGGEKLIKTFTSCPSQIPTSSDWNVNNEVMMVCCHGNERYKQVVTCSVVKHRAGFDVCYCC